MLYAGTTLNLGASSALLVVHRLGIHTSGERFPVAVGSGY